MLYDPKWEQKTETKADPFTLESLIGWLEKQPADKGYQWADCDRCLVGVYLSAVLGESANGSETYHRHDKFMDANPSAFTAGLAISKPHTFGAALARARAIQRSRS